ncbi:host specificity protein J [Methylotenera sp.]|uniref:host specificity protein J n=1 Tax=Methylotenera sp. TaxID=2051956 RepID=UPI0024891DB2|nr:phage tail protein [Methylotenera sp.]MDI1362504.1 phage tail protein [Methylotenera sp.]
MINEIEALGSEITVNLDTGKIFITGSGGGGKSGGSARVAQEADNTLRSAAVVKVIEVISEGPIVGIAGGARGIFINNTPLANSDGTFNFPRVSWDYRVGLPSQDYMAGFVDTASVISINAPLLKASPVITSVVSGSVDAIKLVMLLPEGLSSQNVSNGDVNGTSVAFQIDVRLGTSGPWTNSNYLTISGKTTSAYEAQYRVARPAGTGIWQYKVTRTTADSTTVALKNKTTVARATEIVDVKLQYNDTAVIGLAIDAQSVGSTIPTRSYMVKGKIVSIPANYNPETRVYATTGAGTTAGVWNGTFVQAWTQNPVWVLYDLLTHPRYGMGEYVVASDIDAYSFYDAAVYCDALVPDGNGGTEPRFTFGANIVTQEDAGKLLQLVAGSFRARLLQINGKWTVLQDRPSSPVRNITNSNVIDGLFIYKSTGLFERHTAFNVAWNNRADRYLQKVSTLEDTAAIARYGYFPIDIASYGATTEGQALRTAKWALDTEQNQTETVGFKMGLNGFDLLPNDIFNLYDEDYTSVNGSGRVKSNTGTSIVLDKPITITGPASPATITVTLADGTSESRPLTQTAGTYTTVTATTAFSSALMEDSIYILTSAISARQFKVLNIRFPDVYTAEVEALVHDPAKYSRIELGISIPTPVFNTPSPTNSTVVLPPTGIAFAEDAVANPDGSITRHLLVSWVAPAGGSVIGGYQVVYTRNNGGATILSTPTNSVSIPANSDGTYDISIISQDGAGRLSGSSLTGSYVVDHAVAGVISAVNSVYVKGTSGTTWNTGDLTIVWSDAASPLFVTQDYEVIVKDVSNNQLFRAVTKNREFTYTLAQNKADNLNFAQTPQPALNITITPRDLFTRLSTATTVSFNNPAPTAPTLTLVSGMTTIGISVSPETSGDYVSTEIHASSTDGFVPSSLTKIYSGNGTFFMHAGLGSSSVMYYKAAHFDSYNRAGTPNYSAQYSATPSASLGGAGNSARIAYLLTTQTSLASTPSTVTSAGATSFPPVGTVSVPGAWGDIGGWTDTPSAISAGQYLFKVDGIYSPVSGNTVWNAPYQASFKVGKLEALSAILGNVGAGTITLDLAGHVKGGQSDYDTGVGYYLGYTSQGLSGSRYGLSMRNANNDSFTFDDSGMKINGSLTVISGTPVPVSLNGTFDNLTGWYIASGAALPSAFSVINFQGSGSAAASNRLALTASTTATVVYSMYSGKFAVTPGTTYDFSTQVYVDLDSTVYTMTVTLCTTSAASPTTTVIPENAVNSANRDTDILSYLVGANTGGSWVTLTGSAIVPTGATYASLLIQVKNA